MSQKSVPGQLNCTSQESEKIVAISESACDKTESEQKNDCCSQESPVVDHSLVHQDMEPGTGDRLLDSFDHMSPDAIRALILRLAHSLRLPESNIATIFASIHVTQEPCELP